mgnify:CR=1 FL=1
MAGGLGGLHVKRGISCSGMFAFLGSTNHTLVEQIAIPPKTVFDGKQPSKVCLSIQLWPSLDISIPLSLITQRRRLIIDWHMTELQHRALLICTPSSRELTSQLLDWEICTMHLVLHHSYPRASS